MDATNRGPAGGSSDLDIAATRPTGVVKTAAALLALTGLFEVTIGAQTIASVVFFAEWARVVPYLQVALGAAQLLVAAHLYRARYWAATAAVGLGTFGFVATTAWEGLVIVWGVFSCLALLVVPLALGAMVTSILALRPCRRAEEVRERLRDEGLELGF